MTWLVKQPPSPTGLGPLSLPPPASFLFFDLTPSNSGGNIIAPKIT